MKSDMKIKHFIPIENKIIDLSSFSFDLPFLIERMKHEEYRKKEPLNAVTLLHTPGKRVVLVALEPDTEIKSYQAQGSLKLQVFEGEIKFHTRKNTVMLTSGQKLMTYEKTKYTLTALEVSIVLLTITSQVEN
jgi:hypothetical protein